MSEEYEAVCKNYLTNPDVLTEFKEALESTTSTVQKRFALRFCRWLMGTARVDIPLTSIGAKMIKEMVESKKSTPPKMHEIATLYKMITTAKLTDRQLSVSIEYNIGHGKVSDIYFAWLKIVRDNPSSFPIGMLPSKTFLRWDKGAIYQWGVGDNMFVVNHNGELVKDPHEIAYNSSKWDASLIEWAYSIEPERPTKYVAKFVNRKAAEGLTMKDALEHAYAENWGIVAAILQNHRFDNPDTDKKVWRSIMYSNIDYVNDRLKSIDCAIIQFDRGYIDSDDNIWCNIFKHAMNDKNSEAVSNLIRAACNTRSYRITCDDVSRSLVQRYENTKRCYLNVADGYLVKNTIYLFAMSRSCLEVESKNVIYEAILEKIKDKELSNKNSLEWLKNWVLNDEFAK